MQSNALIIIFGNYSARGPTQNKNNHQKIRWLLFELCRGTVTRTQDPLVPNQMR